MPSIELGPDRWSDVRFYRPYFLLTLGDENQQHNIDSLMERLQSYKGVPYSDIFIVSHGWHRKVADAVSTYDRLVSRLMRMERTLRVDKPPSYLPLYICIHWHSEVGENFWLDRSGRRDRESFFQRVRENVQHSGRPEFERELDTFFALFTASSVSPEATQSDPVFRTLVDYLSSSALNFNRLAGNSSGDRERDIREMVSTLWTCYHEARRKRSAPEGEADVLPPAPALLRIPSRIVHFATVIASIAFILGFLPAVPYHGQLIRGFNALLCWPALLVVPAVCWILLEDQWALYEDLRLDRFRKESSWYTVLLCVATISFSIFPLIWCIVTYMPPLRWVSGLLGRFGERIGKRGKSPSSSVGRATTSVSSCLRHWLRAVFVASARRPLQIGWRLIPEHGRLSGLLAGLDSQLAFWEMQERAADVGDQLGAVTAQLTIRYANLEKSRIHLIGHSFGASVVANAARNIAYDEARTSNIASLCLLQGAIGQDWFEREEHVLKVVKETVSCVYSRFDTATGFFYPLSNFGRRAMGAVGLPAKLGPISFVAPPAVIPLLLKSLKIDESKQQVINCDGSSVITEGAVLTGGGHADIFNDDVIQLIWRFTVGGRQPERRQPQPTA